MKVIEVKLTGRFKQDFNKEVKKGREVIIDRMGTEADSASGVMCRVVNIWTRPTWFDIDWFIFDKKKGGGKK